jgi:hypothetical protein
VLRGNSAHAIASALTELTAHGAKFYPHRSEPPTGALASFRRLERISASHPLLKFNLRYYPPSVVSLIHSAAHRSGRQARVAPSVILFPSYAKYGETQLRALAALQTMTRLIETNTDLHRPATGAALAEFLQFVERTPAYELGAATLASGLYPTPGERMIGDIDVLIPSAKLAGAVEHLFAAGYQPVAADEELPKTEDYGLKHHHYPAIYSLDWPAPVELHVHPVHLPVARLLGSEEVVRDATPLSLRGGDCLLPSPTHFVMHNVIQAFVMDIRDRGCVSLRQLFEFVYASRTNAERIDWAAIQQRFDSLGYGSALRGYAVLAIALSRVGFGSCAAALPGRRAPPRKNRTWSGRSGRSGPVPRLAR